MGLVQTLLQVVLHGRLDTGARRAREDRTGAVTAQPHHLLPWGDRQQTTGRVGRFHQLPAFNEGCSSPQCRPPTSLGKHPLSNAGRVPPGDNQLTTHPASHFPKPSWSQEGMELSSPESSPSGGHSPGPKLRGQDKLSGARTNSLPQPLPLLPGDSPLNLPQTELLQKGR